MVKYYFFMRFIILGETIYNGIFYETYKSDICKKLDIQNNSNSAVEVVSSIHLTNIPLVLTIKGAILIFLFFIMLISLRSFSSMIPV